MPIAGSLTEKYQEAVLYAENNEGRTAFLDRDPPMNVKILEADYIIQGNILVSPVVTDGSPSQQNISVPMVELTFPRGSIF